jgi:hypothetical protein
MNSARARAIPAAIAVVALALAAGAPRTAASAPDQAATQATPAAGVLDHSTAPLREQDEHATYQDQESGPWFFSKYWFTVTVVGAKGTWHE